MTDSTMTEIPREGLVVWTLVDKLLHEAAALEALGLRDAPGICREAAAMLKAAVDALRPFALHVEIFEGESDLARLLQLAAAGHEGVDLGELTDEELDAWIKRH